MRGLAKLFSGSLSNGSEAVSYMVGLLVIGTALAVGLISSDFSVIVGWVLDFLGIGFIMLLAALIFITLFSVIRMNNAGNNINLKHYWYSLGMQAANGVTTLALTFTLLGISLGIGGLADQNLTPETVQEVIRDLTANFSLAFMTTVVGLPVSAVLRAILVMSHTKLTTT